MAPSAYLLASFGLLSVAYYVYRLLLPKPLPGIPYRKESAKIPLGDMAEVKRVGAATGEPSLAMFKLARKLGAPICQMLSASFIPPLLIVDDPREAEDILLRRNREFDRSDLTTNLFSQLLPYCTIAQVTTPQLKAQKRLWSDVMNADFLRRVVAPNIHLAAAELMELWKLKSARFGDAPFPVSKDFSYAALDAIWVAVLGSKLDVVRNEIEKLEPSLASRSDDPERAKKVQSATVMRDSMEYANYLVDQGVQSLFVAVTLFLHRLTPRYRRFVKVRDREVTRLMTEACERFQRIENLGESGEGEEFDTCAMDLVLRREIITARKNGKPVPDPTKDPAMLQELLLLLLAGHDSTANTLSWFVKIMAAYQGPQATLRRALQSAFDNKVPETAAEILDAEIPYLDASVEETVRVAGTAGITTRQALVDTEVLGCRIPKGAHLLLNIRIMYPPMDVAENLRSASSQAAQAKRTQGGFDGHPGRDLHLFEPRRWMTKDSGGKEVFDAYALPTLTFGGGLRGCFGKRLAIHELKIIMVHLIMNFEFLPLPEDLDNMDGRETIFRTPKNTHVRLRVL